MCIYDVWAILMLILRYLDRKETGKNNWYAVGSGLLLILMCFRSGYMYPDLGGYTRLYLGQTSTYEDVGLEQPFITFWNKLLHLLFPESPFLFIVLSSLLYIVPLIIAIKLYSKDKLGSLVCLLVFPGTLMVIMITLRQALSQGLLLIGLLWFTQRWKLWKIGMPIMLVAACLCHSTAFLIIPLMIGLYFLKLNRKIMTAIIIASLFFTNTFISFFSEFFFTELSSVEELNRLMNYSESTGNEITKYIVFLPQVILLFYIFYCKRNQEDNNFFEKMLFVGVLLFNLFANFDSHLIYRFVNFFFMVGFIGALPEQKLDKYHLMDIIFLGLIYYGYRTNLHIYSDDFMVYKFFWE